MTLEDLKTYLRIDGSDDDVLIQSLMTAASSYIKKTTGKTQIITGANEDGTPVLADITTDELWCLTVKLMVAHWYENRGVEIPGTLTKISHSVDALINHIAMCGDYT